MNNFTIQTIEFVNVTLENTASSVDSIVIITLLSTFFAAVTLYFAHLRGISISSACECELPELSGGDFKGDAPTSLPVKVTLSVLNLGNRAGIVKDLESEFNPQPDFKEFLRDKEIKWHSIRSAKTNQPASAILIKNQDTDLVIFDGYINLDWGISMRHHLRTLDIESENLKTLLEEMLEYKKELLRNFINFLTKNEKLGDFIITYNYTKLKFIFWIKFKKEANTPPIEVKHSYKKTIECYEDSLKNYQLYPHPTEIIKSILKSIKELKEEFDRCRKAIEESPMDGIPHLSLNIDWINRIFRNEEEDFELLSKCRNYQKTIEDDVKPLLKKLLNFYEKVRRANREPTRKEKQSLIREINDDIKELREKLIDVSTKVENLKKEVEQELS